MVFLGVFDTETALTDADIDIRAVTQTIKKSSFTINTYNISHFSLDNILRKMGLNLRPNYE